MGGYFIVNGLEKLIRLLVVPRRHYVMAQSRNAFSNRGPRYTPYATSIRCVGRDEISRTVYLHYLDTGAVNLRLAHNKAEYLIPWALIAKALVPTTDKQIFDSVLGGQTDTPFVSDRIEALLRDAKRYPVASQEQALAYIGSKFRIVLSRPDSESDVNIGHWLIRRYIFIHLPSYTDKFNLLVYMLQKLYGVVSGAVAVDNADALHCQEALTPGRLYQILLSERLEEWMESVATSLNFLLSKRSKAVGDGMSNIADDGVFKSAMDLGKDIGNQLDYFMATGNLRSKSGLDLSQVSGYTIVAEKLNFLRYLGHFRGIHRGSFFTEMRTTAVRKLLPEAWGFVCPVHTPDGTPCGLLNHLTANCRIQTESYDTTELPALLAGFGMTPQSAWSSMASSHHAGVLPVLLDGRVLGVVELDAASGFAASIRKAKVSQSEGPGALPESLEIGLVLPATGGPAPGVFLWTSPNRFLRPVLHIRSGLIEWIGAYEQVFMEIACGPEELRPGLTTHQELDPTNILSIIASLTPFSDFNQSPRNMYQCQMGKQTMGTPYLAFPHRTDNKSYRIHTPQTPLTRTKAHDQFGMDEYPTGTNAVVAVISYTGYDMEDAMILNKSAYERGFGHGSVYKSFFADLEEDRKRGESVEFGNADMGEGFSAEPSLDEDGVIPRGAQVTKGDALYRTINYTTRTARVVRHKDMEDAVVDQARVIGASGLDVSKIGLTLRYNRNPVIGDKFSSRHGQKGVLSQLWPAENMPFTESGMTPDVIINPHAFPSRMTIGMLVESMAGKSGALHGMFQDATPFAFHDSGRHAVDHFGEQLAAAGYHYHGSEPMYSGIYGTQMQADIYIGLVYYQRLRHMVKDKYQVRSLGPVDKLTRQPVKGRKRSGGIRLGEMERDSLLAHGTAFLLHDRLLQSSDEHTAFLCSLCGSILSPLSDPSASGTASLASRMYCNYCNTSKGIEMMSLPYVFRYLVVELAAMNIRVSLITDNAGIQT